MVERFPAGLGGFNGNAQVGLDFLLAEIFPPAAWPQLRFIRLAAQGFPGQDAFFVKTVIVFFIHGALEFKHAFNLPSNSE